VCKKEEVKIILLQQQGYLFSKSLNIICVESFCLSKNKTCVKCFTSQMLAIKYMGTLTFWPSRWLETEVIWDFVNKID